MVGACDGCKRLCLIFSALTGSRRTADPPCALKVRPDRLAGWRRILPWDEVIVLLDRNFEHRSVRKIAARPVRQSQQSVVN